MLIIEPSARPPRGSRGPWGAGGPRGRAGSPVGSLAPWGDSTFLLAPGGDLGLSPWSGADLELWDSWRCPGTSRCVDMLAVGTRSCIPPWCKITTTRRPKATRTGEI